MFSLKSTEKALVLFCFRSKMLKNHWFYYVFAQKCWKTTGFTVFSLDNVKKPLVLLCFRSKVLKKHWFYCVFAQKGWKTIGFIVKMQKSEKTIGFTVKKFKKEQKPLENLWFFEKKGRKTNFGLRIRAVTCTYSSG